MPRRIHLILKGDLLALQGLKGLEIIEHTWDQGWHALPKLLQTWETSPQDVTLYAGGEGSLWTWESFSPVLGWSDRIRLFQARRAFLRKSMDFWLLKGCFWNPKEILSVGCALSPPLKALVGALRSSSGVASLKIYSLSLEKAALVYRHAHHNGCLFLENTLTIVVLQNASLGPSDDVEHFVFWGKTPLLGRKPRDSDPLTREERISQTPPTEEALRKAALETATYVGRWSQELEASSAIVFLLHGFPENGSTEPQFLESLEACLLSQKTPPFSLIGPLRDHRSLIEKWVSLRKTLQAPARQKNVLQGILFALLGIICLEGVLMKIIWRDVQHLRKTVPIFEKQIQEGKGWEASLPIEILDAQKLLSAWSLNNVSLLFLKKAKSLIQTPIACQKLLWRRTGEDRYWMKLWVFDGSLGSQPQGTEDVRDFNDRTWENWKAALPDVCPGAQLVRGAPSHASRGARAPPLWELTVRWSNHEPKEATP